MPVAYPIPPWIAMQAPPNPASAYISALHEGAQLGLERDQMQQRRQLAEQELQARQTEQEQRHELEQQKLQYDHALQTAELGLQQQKLDESNQLNQIKIQEASRKFAAQQRVQAAIASGTKPEEAMFAEAANLDLGGGDLAALLKASKPPPSLGGVYDIGEGYRAVNTSQGARKILPPPKPAPTGEVQPATTPDGQPIPNTFIGPKGQTIHQARDPNDPAVVKRQILLKQRGDIAKTLSTPALLAAAVQREMVDNPKENQKTARAKVLKTLEDKLADIDKQIQGTATGSSKGGGGRLIYDPKTKKFSKSTASASSPATDELADDEESGSEGSDEETEEA